MKGISPIVAAVLLIAITMTIAGGLALWATRLVGEQLPNPEEIIECKLANFDFLSCTYNASTQNLIFSLINRGSLEMKNLTAILSYPNGSSSSDMTLNSTLQTGTNKVSSFTISDIPSDFSYLLITTMNCPEVEASDSCTRS